MNGHVLQTLREQLKVPGSRLEGSELLTSEFLRFRSRLNETSGGLGKIGAVSGSDSRILKFLRTAFLALFFDQRTVKEPSTDTLLRLAELVLTLNCFTFSGEIFKQINGVAMGTKMGPNYANLFVGYVEEQIFNQFDGPKPELFGRYIDDCLGATSCTKEELERFIGFVNSFHPALKFTWEISETLFSISTFLSKTTNWQPVSTTNPQIRTVTYCTRLPTHLTSKTQFRTPNFSDSVGSAAKIQTLTPNATKCPISFPNVAILTASCLKHSIVSKTSIENPL